TSVAVCPVRMRIGALACVQLGLTTTGSAFARTRSSVGVSPACEQHVTAIAAESASKDARSMSSHVIKTGQETGERQPKICPRLGGRRGQRSFFARASAIHNIISHAP